MSERKPQKGDLVQITIRGTVDDLDDHGNVAMLVGEDEKRAHYVPRPFEVEVLEPAADPEIGLIRRTAPDLAGHSHIAVKVGASLSTRPGERSVWVIVETGEVLAPDNVDVDEVLGSVPGTPAAEQRRETDDELPDWEKQLLEGQSPECTWRDPSECPVHGPLASLSWAPDFRIPYRMQKGAVRQWRGQTGRLYTDRDGWLSHPEVARPMPVLSAWFFDGPMTEVLSS